METDILEEPENSSYLSVQEREQMFHEELIEFGILAF